MVSPWLSFACEVEECGSERVLYPFHAPPACALPDAVRAVAPGLVPVAVDAPGLLAP
jgi:hypothetical protein